MSVLIKNGTIVTAERSYRADLFCENGVIAGIGENLQGAGVDRTIDAEGHYVMPGGIDPHTHMAL